MSAWMQTWWWSDLMNLAASLAFAGLFSEVLSLRRKLKRPVGSARFFYWVAAVNAVIWVFAFPISVLAHLLGWRG